MASMGLLDAVLWPVDDGAADSSRTLLGSNAVGFSLADRRVILAPVT